ncbi:hypothetical protein LTR95_000463 [Oleoguttula sp. CCFEE 5521]
MPVSHLGLTVSHIPSSTSFYLAALQPLGYRFLGTQGNTVGLGVRDADLFLCPAARGIKLVPTHVALTAKSRVAVRECYSAALGAGGWPSGAPSYRNDDCSCFNAAVEDLDGNTVEFIFRERNEAASSDDSTASHGVRRGRDREFPPPARSKTALDVTNRDSLRTPTLKRSDTMPATSAQPDSGPAGLSNDTSRALMGTLLGAAAGAAFAFAMVHAERDGAYKEATFSTATRSSGRDAAKGSRASRRPMSERPIIRQYRQRSDSESRYTVHPQTTVGVRQPRAIAYKRHEEDVDAQRALMQYSAPRRPQPPRSKTYDTRSSGNTDYSVYVPRRSITVVESPGRQPLLLMSAEKPASRYFREPARESSDKLSPRRRDSVLSTQSHHSSRYTQPSKGETRSTTSNISAFRTQRKGDDDRQRNGDASNASRRTGFSTRSRRSKATSYFDAAEQVQEPMALEDAGGLSDGMDDTRTIVPDDSISCVDFSPPRTARSDRRRRTGVPQEGRSESTRSTSTVKFSKSRRSAINLPVRAREQTDQHSYRRTQGAASYT